MLVPLPPPPGSPPHHKQCCVLDMAACLPAKPCPNPRKSKHPHSGIMPRQPCQPPACTRPCGPDVRRRKAVPKASFPAQPPWLPACPHCRLSCVCVRPQPPDSDEEPTSRGAVEAGSRDERGDGVDVRPGRRQRGGDQGPSSAASGGGSGAAASSGSGRIDPTDGRVSAAVLRMRRPPLARVLHDGRTFHFTEPPALGVAAVAAARRPA